MYAIFLLVLLADVARAHASAPAGSDAGLILSAASQLQVGSADGAGLMLRRSDISSSQVATFGRFAMSFSGWSRNLSDFSHSAMQPDTAYKGHSDNALALIPASESTSPFQEIFEHTGSPAP